ncbi:hypothetical protein SNEBB_004268 [Seison nebaliae]|nr:hypothetical protein SNEBB_004268 [Seison nebaliae]
MLMLLIIRLTSNRNINKRISDGLSIHSILSNEEHHRIYELMNGYVTFNFYLSFGGMDYSTLGFCGGTAIGINLVLTAAHCFSSSPTLVTQSTYALINLKRLDGSAINRQVYRVRRVHIHERFTSKSSNGSEIEHKLDDDIAIVVVDKKIPKEFIRNLPEKNSKQFELTNKVCYVCGYGRVRPQLSNSDVDYSYSNYLKMAKVLVVDHIIQIVNHKFHRIKDSHISTIGLMSWNNWKNVKLDESFIHYSYLNETEKEFDLDHLQLYSGPCSGDSGSGLFCKDDLGQYILEGITSFGNGCGIPGRFDIYTRTSSYLLWINDIKNRYSFL